MTDARLAELEARIVKLERQVATLLMPHIAGEPGMWGMARIAGSPSAQDAEWIERVCTCGTAAVCPIHGQRTCDAPAIGPVCDTAQIEGGET